MIQDIFPHHLNNAYRDEIPQDDSVLIPVFEQKIFCRSLNGEAGFLTVSEAENLLGLDRGSLRFLFSIDDKLYFLYGEKLPDAIEGAPEGFSYVPLMAFRFASSGTNTFAAAVAGHIAHFYSENRFCSVCGSPLRHSGTLRCLICDSCGKHVFPRINPVSITAVVDKDKILAARYNKKHARTRSDQYVLIAGYVEVGESYEEAARREVKEETGLDISNIRYMGSQPWPYSDSTIAGFFAEADSSLPLKREEDELSELLWVKREDLPPRKNLMSITDNLFERFRLDKMG